MILKVAAYLHFLLIGLEAVYLKLSIRFLLSLLRDNWCTPHRTFLSFTVFMKQFVEQMPSLFQTNGRLLSYHQCHTHCPLCHVSISRQHSQTKIMFLNRETEWQDMALDVALNSNVTSWDILFEWFEMKTYFRFYIYCNLTAPHSLLLRYIKEQFRNELGFVPGF